LCIGLLPFSEFLLGLNLGQHDTKLLALATACATEYRGLYSGAMYTGHLRASGIDIGVNNCAHVGAECGKTLRKTFLRSLLHDASLWRGRLFAACSLAVAQRTLLGS
jgi:hypothetical protein